MARLNYIIKHVDTSDRDDIGNLGPDAERDISKAVNLNTKSGIETSVDTFNFNINISNLPKIDGVPLDIEPEDLIKIYIGTETVEETSSYLVIDGKVDRIVTNYTESGKMVKVNGVNRLEAVLNGLQPFSGVSFPASVNSVSGGTVNITLDSGDIDTDKMTDMTLAVTSGTAQNRIYHIDSIANVSGGTADLTVDGGDLGNDPETDGLAGADTVALSWNSPKIIESLITTTNTQRTSGGDIDWKEIQWASTNLYVRSDSRAFPPITYSQPHKPIFQQIEELSTNQYTGDGTYLFYLDMASGDPNDFIWKSRPSAISSTVFSRGRIDGPHSPATNINAERGTFDAANTVIIDAGKDLTGASLFAVAYNLTSIAKMGQKWKYVPYSELATQIKDEENITIDNTFPYGDVSDWAGGYKESTKNTYTADNSGFRNYLRDRARSWGTQYTIRLGSPRWRVAFTIRGSLSYTLGAYHELEIPTLGWDISNRKLLRISQINHSFTKNGWETTLMFEEDEEDAINQFKKGIGS